MRNQYAHDGPLFSGPEPSPNPTPLQELRSEIGQAADALTRMLDLLQGDDYEKVDWLAVAGHLTQADMQVEAMWELIDESALRDIDDADPLEGLDVNKVQFPIVPPRKAAASEGGGA